MSWWSTKTAQQGLVSKQKKINSNWAGVTAWLLQANPLVSPLSRMGRKRRQEETGGGEEMKGRRRRGKKEGEEYEEEAGMLRWLGS